MVGYFFFPYFQTYTHKHIELNSKLNKQKENKREEKGKKEKLAALRAESIEKKKTITTIHKRGVKAAKYIREIYTHSCTY